MNPTTARRLAALSLAAATLVTTSACSSSGSDGNPKVPADLISSAQSRASAALSSARAAASSAAGALPSVVESISAAGGGRLALCTAAISLVGVYAANPDAATVQTSIDAVDKAREGVDDAALTDAVSAVEDAVKAKDQAAVQAASEKLSAACQSALGTGN